MKLLIALALCVFAIGCTAPRPAGCCDEKGCCTKTADAERL